MVGLQFEHLPVPVGDEAVIAVGGEEGQLGTGRGLHTPDDEPHRRGVRFTLEGSAGGLGHIGGAVHPVRNRRPGIFGYRLDEIVQAFMLADGDGEADIHLAADGHAIEGREVDRVARDYIDKAGYGTYFGHRLGHSLGAEVHGNAVNLDGWETNDTRQLIPGVAVTIEPGIYLPDFGVRSEIDVYISESGPEVTTEVQRSPVLMIPNPP